MEAVPLIPKSKVLPNSDAEPLLKELFQDELQAVVPTKKLSQNILTSLQRTESYEDPKPCGSREFLQKYTQRTEDVLEFTENILEAYADHSEKLEEIRNVEKELFETHVHYLKREKNISENPTIRDAICLKKQPLFKALDLNYVKKYKLIQGDTANYVYEAKSDFRTQRFKEWRRKLESLNAENFWENICDKERVKSPFTCSQLNKPVHFIKPGVNRKLSSKKSKSLEKPTETFMTDPKILFFTNFKLGYVYMGKIKLKNTSTKPIVFKLRPLCAKSPFRVGLMDKPSTAISPGLGFQLTVEFTPQTLDNLAEDIVLVTEDGNRFLIPLIAYLEPPILKTHKEINEFTKTTSERITSSYIECGSCFTGDSKVIKLNFRCYRGSGEFFIMTLENWSNGYVDTMTFDNLLEIPPFRVYPVYFKLERDHIIDLFIEFSPKHSGMQVENIIIACNNGQIRSLDLIGDAVGWHSYYFSFQDTLLKELSVEEDDDMKVKYYLDFGNTEANGKVERVFCVSNNSDMAFEFQWKIREANIMSSHKKYLKLSKYQVKIDPENGTFDPNSIWEFQVTITFNNAEIGNYRMVLSLYVLNLPYQCIEEDNTIIQPTGLVRNLYSQSLYGEEEASALSPELASLQGTYESLQESIKSYVEFQNRAQAAPRQDFCRTVCALNPGLCAKPLKKSKTLFNIGETLEDLDGNAFGGKQLESNSESCTSNRDEKLAEMSPQRNEVIWDFVDILVDEVELWVEVMPTRVTLQPSVIKISRPICVSGCPVSKEVRIINHNQSPVICSWLKTSKTGPTLEHTLSGISKRGSNRFSLLFDKSSTNKIPRFSSKQYETLKPCASEGWPLDDRASMSDRQGEADSSKLCEIIIKPCKGFVVPGLSELTCKITIVGCQPGLINETFWLNVNDGDLQLKMTVTGITVVKSIETSPDILDFGQVRQGTRCKKTFTITSQCAVPLAWRINLFNFNFNTEKFVRVNLRESTAIRKEKGILRQAGHSTTETYSLDTRVPGMKFSLIEIETINVKLLHSSKRYIAVVAQVRIPSLCLLAPRFETPILAPSGAMYVGLMKTTEITVMNYGDVKAYLNWGHSFGCHCRKIKVEIYPTSFSIEKNQKVVCKVYLTALEEGIINHCYIPCFYSRKASPLIMSVVGVAHTVNVTFEIIDYPMQNHADASTFKKSPSFHTVLRVPWPIKMYNPTLGFKYLTEDDILNLRCYCHEVEEEVTRAFSEYKQQLTVTSSQKSTRSLKSFDMSDSASLRSKTSAAKCNKSPLEEVQSDDSTQSSACKIDAKKSEENSLTVYSYFETASERFQLNKSHLEFLNVPFRTPTLRQFVIRNETPIATKFQIKVSNYGVAQNVPDKRLEIIKSRVFGYPTDVFESKLMKHQPLLFEVTPSKGELKPFGAVCIDVYCYGNTWGEYRDNLMCQIKGIEPFFLKIFVQIVGHPLYFPFFKAHTSRKATLRFQPLNPVEQSASKEIKVVNRSSIPLKVSWMVFITKPLQKADEIEASFDLSADSNAFFESNHSDEESTQSSKNYIPKNTSDTGKESKDFSQISESRLFLKGESFTSTMRNERRESGSERKNSTIFLGEKTKTETEFQFPGTLDVHTFQVNPKEMSFEPFEEKKIVVTFNPDSYRTKAQEIEGVLTSCVKLQPEHENCPGLYYRPCGISFVSELMDFTAEVVFPFVSFEILKGDLKFNIDSNAVIESESKTVSISRLFFIKNLNQKQMSIKIEVIPGISFQVKKVNTIDKHYPKYSSHRHTLNIEPGHVFEMELECTVSHKRVLQAFEELKMKRTKDTCSRQFADGKKINSVKSSRSENESQTKREPWHNYRGKYSLTFSRASVDPSKPEHKDHFKRHAPRMSSKSDNSICSELYDEGKCFSSEFEGEDFELETVEDMPCKPGPSKPVMYSHEEIAFIHSGAVKQTLVAELQISFPEIIISPKSLDFGNVYLGDRAVRQCCLVNTTGFPINFRVLAKFSGAEFTASPVTGSLPPTNYNADNGKTLTVTFTPLRSGYYNDIFHVYCNMNMEFDFFELTVSGLGTWNEKYKAPKYETQLKVERLYSKRPK